VAHSELSVPVGMGSGARIPDTNRPVPADMPHLNRRADALAFGAGLP
jgi:hypothetical protein